MDPGKRKFSASAPAAGYLYQARLALLLCLPHVNRGSSIEVAVERLDDISFEKDGSPFELLQAKHRIRRTADLTDGSADLWKTLRAWCADVARDPSLPSRAKLVLITTGVVPEGSAASLLRAAWTYPAGTKRDPKTAQELLTAAAENSANKDLKPAFDAFLALGRRMRSSLLSAVEVLDRSPVLGDLGTALEDELRLVAPAGRAAQVRELLEGWWWPRICGALMAEPAGSIAVAAIEAKLDDIRDAMKRAALVADFEDAEPSEAEAAGYDGFKFVKQLQVIGLDPRRLSWAKRDYYRAFAQRSRWTREHVVLDDELRRFEKTLVEEWEPRFHSRCGKHKGKQVAEAKLRQSAQDLYLWVETEARFPFRALTVRSLNVGSYHMLANDLRVGWHRDFRDLCGGER